MCRRLFVKGKGKQFFIELCIFTHSKKRIAGKCLFSGMRCRTTQRCMTKTSTLSADADKVLCDFKAEKEGFEPPEQLPVHRISSAARSTTPAFLLRLEHRKITTDFSSCQGSMSKNEETEWAREKRICIVAKKKRESREKTMLPQGRKSGGGVWIFCSACRIF